MPEATTTILPVKRGHPPTRIIPLLEQWPAILLLALFVGLGLFYSFHNPPFEAPEEGLHLTVARDIAAGRLPPLATKSVGIGEEQQPRLYYLMLVPVVGWADGSFATWLPAPAGWPKGAQLALLGARLLTLLMGLGAVLCGYLLAIEVFGNRRLALAIAGFQAMVPGFILSSSTVNNDNATNLFSALTLLLGARVVCRRAPGWPTWVAYGLAAAAAIWSKATGIFIVFYFVGTLLLALRSGRSRRFRVAVLSTFLLAASLLAVFALGDPNGRLRRVLGGIWDGGSVYSIGNVWWALANTTPEKLLETARNLARTSFDIAGWQAAKDPPGYVYQALFLLMLVSTAGVLRYLSGRHGWRALARPAQGTLGLLFVTFVLVLGELFLIQWGKPGTMHHWGITHARYLFPVLAVGSLAVVGGLAAVLPSAWRPVVVSCALAGLLVFDLTRSFYMTSDASTPLLNDLSAKQAGAALAGEYVGNGTSFASGMTLLGYRIGPEALAQQGTVRVQLLWRADENLKYDYRVFAHIVDRKGEAVSKSDLTATGYRFPPRLWRQGDVVLDDRHLTMPADAPPGRYAVQVGVYAFADGAEGKILPVKTVSNGTSPVRERLTLGRVQIVQPALPEVEIARQMGASFGGELRLLGSGPLQGETRAGEEQTITLYWQAERPLSTDYTVSLQVLNAVGQLVAQADDQPQEGGYPTSSWRLGEIVRDTRRWRLPANLPPADYTIAVVVYSLPAMTRLPVAAENGSQGDFLPLGTISVPSPPRP